MNKLLEEHFRSFYRSWVKRVYCRVKNDADAEDIVMEAYARALKYQHTFVVGNNLDYWFSRIIANTVKDWKREQHNQFGHTEVLDEDNHPIPDPSIKRDLFSTLQAEINKIENPEQVEILSLYFLLGYKQHEVVHITNATAGSVNMLVHKFKVKLKGRYME
jgi:RNA polymerase sigma factor (sigma-70 family)